MQVLASPVSRSAQARATAPVSFADTTLWDRCAMVFGLPGASTSALIDVPGIMGPSGRLPAGCSNTATLRRL